jgi:predicted dehydrogenase
MFGCPQPDRPVRSPFPTVMPETSPTPTPVVVAGCGAITKFFYASALGFLEARGVVQVAALCDPHGPNRQVIQARFPRARGLERLEEATLAPGTLVVVASPPKLHAAQTILALENGCGVLCEKPMAGTLADAQAMTEAAERTGRPLAIGLYRRFFRSAQVIKDLCTSGALGRVVSFEVEEGGPFRWEAASDSFFRRASTPGGVLYDTGVHTLDLLLWWFGEPRDVAYRDDAAGGLEANCTLQLGFAAGPSGQVRLSRDWLTRNLFRINFEHGSVAWQVGQAGRLTLSISGVTTVLGADVLPAADDGLSLSADTGAEGSPQAFIRQILNVVEAIRGRAPVHIPGVEGLRSLRLIEACYLARQPLELPWLSPAEHAGLGKLQTEALR